MRYHIQETIFPDRHTVSVMNPQTGDFLPVAEIQDMGGWGAAYNYMPPIEGTFRTTDKKLRSAPSERLEEFAAMVAKFYSPFEKLRASDYTGNLFE